MLSDDLKQTIQAAYSRVLDSKQLQPRWGQRVMIAEIAKTLVSARQYHDHEEEIAPFCVIEAGTGTGKTLAYTLAVIPLARAEGKKVVIATATVALQEQIVFRDLPDIQQHSGLDFSFALAKGRSRYLCLSKLDGLLAEAHQQSPTLALYPDEIKPQVDADSMQVYQSMLEALATGAWQGDRDSWLQQLEDKVWYALTSDSNQCAGRRCHHVSQCSFFKAREELHGVDCIVANHDLVLADLALGGGIVLPDPAETFFIFDEGHHLPIRALSHFSATTRLQGTLKWLDQSQKLLSALAKQLSTVASLQTIIERIPTSFEQIKQHIVQTQPLLESVVENIPNKEIQSTRAQRQSKGESLYVHRFAHGHIPEALQALALELSAAYTRLLGLLEGLQSEVNDLLEDQCCELDKSELEVSYGVLGQLMGRATGHCALWSHYSVSLMPDMPDARWLELLDSGGHLEYVLYSSPILAHRQLEEYLWSRCYGAVVTSATLSALESFDRFKMQSGMPELTNYKQVPSPFDYQHSAVFRVPDMSCEPGDVQHHTQAIVDQLPQLCHGDKGVLVLFASRRQMLDVYADLTPDYRQRVLVQGDYSKMDLLRRHREAVDEGDSSVIFGLASFAEGVDLPGSYCTHVIIAKIPFAVPDDPVEAALAEWLSNKGRNPFMEITVPDAALRLVQACGRLLRCESDSGRITLLDRRIVTKRYGQAILNSLPPFRREVA